MKLAQALWLVALAACRAGEDYREPELALPPRFEGESTTLEESETRWWRRFGDPVLDELVTRVVERNRDMVVALQRVEEARAIVEIEGGAARPSIDGGASFLRQDLSNNVVGGSFYPSGVTGANSIGFDARWEIDLFGHTERAVEAASAGLGVAVEDARATLQRLLAETVREYVEMRGFERQLELVRASLATQQESAGLVASRVAAGLDGEVAAARFEALLANTRASLPLFESARAARRHALDVLTGASTDEIAASLDAPRPIPQAPDAIATGMPVDLLRRRPDVRRGERELARAAALTAAAVTELYPRLSLAATLGWQSEHAGELFDAPSRAWSAGPSLLGPLFRSGVIQAGIRARGAQEAAALANYEQAVLEALREVEDALAAFTNSRRRVESLAAAAEAEDRALGLVRERYAGGLVDYLAVLDAQRGELAASSALARGRTDHAVAAIALYKALGGGWEHAGVAIASD